MVIRDTRQPRGASSALRADGAGCLMEGVRVLHGLHRLRPSIDLGVREWPQNAVSTGHKLKTAGQIPKSDLTARTVKPIFERWNFFGTVRPLVPPRACHRHALGLALNRATDGSCSSFARQIWTCRSSTTTKPQLSRARYTAGHDNAVQNSNNFQPIPNCCPHTNNN